MRERLEPALKGVCLLLGVLLLGQLGWLVPRLGLLRGVKIPALPGLASAAEAPGGGKGTNAISASTTNIQSKSSTNAVASSSSNAVLSARKSLSSLSTNALASNPSNAALSSLKSPSSLSTNALASGPSNAVLSSLKSLSSLSPTNASAATNATAAGGPAAPRPGSGRSSRSPIKLTDLPPALLARVDRVVDSELLGPVAHPMPTSLLGIAGNVAFLRGANGQSSVVKEGDNLGNIKLLRIGINRVLVEEEGQKKELMIFDGYGSETLLPK
jgi:hypothetical protein